MRVTTASWLACLSENGQSRQVIPLGDWRPHENTEHCWCSPSDEDGVYVHYSMDGREFYERGERKPS